MKKHAIIPIFIPHKGCPNDCVFCNQKTITAKTADVSGEDVKRIADTWLTTLNDPRPDTLEMAFFGGSFTGIPIDQQNEYLDVALDYKHKGLIDKIHMSTRPDYIDESILDNLKKHEVDVIELGVQSFDQDVLNASKRGHSVESVYNACDLIKKYGFTLGIQLMIGLPNDNIEKAFSSAQKTVEIGPQIARLYPTVILEDTELAEMFRNGSYVSPNFETIVEITTGMYRILSDAGIQIIRVGLKSTDLIKNSTDLAGMYHPAFRQVVQSRIALEDMEKLLSMSGYKESDAENIIFYSNSKCFSDMIGHRASNKNFFNNKYTHTDFSYKIDDSLDDDAYAISIAESEHIVVK